MMVTAEPRFDRGNLVELLRRELGAERVDRLQQSFGALAAGNGVVGEPLGEGERLRLGVAALERRRWAAISGAASRPEGHR